MITAALKTSRLWTAIVASLLISAGAGLWLASERLPAFTDDVAFQAAADAILFEIDSDPSTHYFELLDRMETSKWRLLDCGLSLLTWGGLLMGICLMGPKRTVRAHRRLLVILPLTLCGLLVLTVGLLADPYLRILRHEVPSWSDSFAIPMFETFRLMRLVAPIILALALFPLMRSRTTPVSLLGPRPAGRWSFWSAATFLYAVPILLLTLMLTLAFEPGGWLTSAGGLTLIWVLMNGRALILAPRVAAA